LRLAYNSQSLNAPDIEVDSKNKTKIADFNNQFSKEKMKRLSDIQRSIEFDDDEEEIID